MIYELLAWQLKLEHALSADISDAFTSTPDLMSYTFVPLDTRIFDPCRARIVHPKTAAQRVALLDCAGDGQRAP